MKKKIFFLGSAIFFLLCLLLAVSNLSLAKNFTYDNAGRLTKVTYDNFYSISYTYDNNGNVTAIQKLPPPDTDADGLQDHIEDANHNNIVDPGETDPNNPDTDGDGILDGTEDANHNGIVDPGETDPTVFDLDSDQDGVADSIDNCPDFQNTNQKDVDDDSFGDVCDNCPLDYNPDQADADDPTDGVGNACDDGDADGDGFSDKKETQCDSDPGDPNSFCSKGLPWIMLLLE